MSPGWVALPYLVPHVRPPEENRGHVQAVKAPVGGKRRPSQGHQRREDVQGAGERGGFHQSKEQRSLAWPPNPTYTPQPLARWALGAPMAGEHLGEGVVSVVSQHPSQPLSSAEKVKTSFKQQLSPSPRFAHLPPLAPAARQALWVQPGAAAPAPRKSRTTPGQGHSGERGSPLLPPCPPCPGNRWGRQQVTLWRKC